MHTPRSTFPGGEEEAPDPYGRVAAALAVVTTLLIIFYGRW